MDADPDYDLHTFFFNLEASQDYSSVFKDNGFDDFDTLLEFTEEHLIEMGITHETDRMILLERRDILNDEEKSAALFKDYADFVTAQAVMAEENLGINTRRPQGDIIAITKKMLLAASPSMKKYPHESKEQFLARLTHLKLNGKGIGQVRELDLCSKLRVLYLYDNKLSSIHGLESCRHLTHLHLQNNFLTEIQGLDSCTKIIQLDLNRNSICRLEGLTALSQLEDLNLADQQLNADAIFTFEEASLEGIAPSLNYLNLRNCQIYEFSDLYRLTNIVSINLEDNKIEDFETATQVLRFWDRLDSLRIKGNPIAELKKSRDLMVMASMSMTQLDGKSVTMQEREFLYKLNQLKVQKSKEGDGRPHKENIPKRVIPNFPSKNAMDKAHRATQAGQKKSKVLGDARLAVSGSHVTYGSRQHGLSSSSSQHGSRQSSRQGTLPGHRDVIIDQTGFVQEAEYEEDDRDEFQMSEETLKERLKKWNNE